MSEGSQPAITQQIKLEILTPRKVEGGLSELVKQLDSVEGYIERINSKLSQGVKIPPQMARSYDEIKRELEKSIKLKGNISADEAAKALGLDPAMVRSRLQKIKGELEGFRKTTLDFTTIPKAAGGMHQVLQAEIKELEKARVGLGKLLTPTVASVQGVAAPGASILARVEGQIPLIIPATQFQASVSGPITLTVPVTASGAGAVGSPLPGGSAAGGRGPDGRFLPGEGAPSLGKKAAAKKSGPLQVPQQPGEFERTRVEDHLNDRIRETVTRADALGQTVSETWDSVEQALVKTVRKGRTGNSPLEQFRTKRQLEQESFRQGKASLAKGDYFGLAALQEKQASQLQALLSDDLKTVLGPAQTKRLQSLLEARSGTLRAEAGHSRVAGRAAINSEIQEAIQQVQRDQSREVRTEVRRAAAQVKLRRKQLEADYSDTFRTGRGPFFGQMAIAEEQRATRLEGALKRNSLIHPEMRGDIQDSIQNARANVLRFSKMANSPAPGVKPTGEYSRFLNGLQAFSPMGFLANVTKVTGWAAAVTVLYKSVELASYSMHRFMEVGQETARLEQVFRGVGGSAKQLTDDMMKLASANGRDTSEAMESATEWSRLGLSRKQVNEAVRVSMAAANVAQMHTKETTGQLSSLMHIYNLEVKDLNGVLGLLTTTSLRYNVTLEDLFTGLDRSAGTARQAGMGLGELQGIIGAMVGKTGQSGIIIGNTVKSILTQFSNPSIQRYLRGYGIETLTKGGQEKSGSQVLRELFVKYQSLDDRERRNLTVTLAGRLQGSRFVAMMDSYVQAQKLAIDSQLQLNRAQEANARIMSTLKVQLAGVRSEWDRLVVRQGNNLAPVLTEGVRFTKNLMRAMNEPGAAPTPQAAEFRKRFVEKSPDKERFENYLLNYQKGHAGNLPGFWSVMFPKLNGPQGNLGGDQALAIWLKLKEESPFERGEEKFRNRVQEHHTAAIAYGMRARLFQTVGEVLGNGHANRPEAVQSMTGVAASEMDKASADAFNQALAARNSMEAQRILEEQAKKARNQSTQEVSAELTERGQRFAEAKAGYDQLGQELDSLKAKSGAEDEINQKLAQQAELEKAMHEMRERNAEDLQFLSEELAQTDEIIERKQEYLNLLKEQESLMQSLEQLSAQGGLETMGGRLDAQAGGLAQQIDSVRQTEMELRHRGGQDDIETANQLRKQLAELEARRAASDSPQMREMATMYDARAIRERRTREEAASYAVGYTESDKLLNERRALDRQMAGLRSKEATGSLTLGDAVRAKELEVQLWSTQEKIQSRIIDLARQEKQIRLDAAREFQKGLLLSGPGELLQRFHVSQLMHQPGGVSTGNFMALSPELKRLYFEAQGGDAGFINRWERRTMRGQGVSVEREQTAQNQARSHIEHWNNIIRGATSGALQNLPHMPLPLDHRARAVSEQLSGMASVLQRVNSALEQFARNLTGHKGHNGTEGGSMASSSLNLSAGYSLGARQST